MLSAVMITPSFTRIINFSGESHSTNRFSYSFKSKHDKILMTMPILRLHFSDFCADHQPEKSYLYQTLSTVYQIELCLESPDLLIFSDFGDDFLQFNCPRLHYTEENILPDLNLCDYAIGPSQFNFQGRCFRVAPFLNNHHGVQSLLARPSLDLKALTTKPKFCNFIYSNPNADPKRDQTFHLINQYQSVESSGKHLNNYTAPISDRNDIDWSASKLPYMSDFRFTIAIENSYGEGYTSEKILDAFLARTVPIYWGNPGITQDFNPDAFINLHQFDNTEAVINEIKRLETHPERYLDILNQPVFSKDQLPSALSPQALIDFFKYTVIPEGQVKKQRPSFGRTTVYERRMKKRCLKKSPLKRILSKLR